MCMYDAYEPKSISFDFYFGSLLAEHKKFLYVEHDRCYNIRVRYQQLTILKPSRSLSTRGVVEGGTPFPKIFLGECRSPKWYQDKGNNDTVAFQQEGLQRNAKSMRLRRTRGTAECRCSKWPPLAATQTQAVERLVKFATAMLMCSCGSSFQQGDFQLISHHHHHHNQSPYRWLEFMYFSSMAPQTWQSGGLKSRQFEATHSSQ